MTCWSCRMNEALRDSIAAMSLGWWGLELAIHSCGTRLRAHSVMRLLLLLEILYGFHMCQVNLGSTCQHSEGAGLTCGQCCVWRRNRRWAWVLSELSSSSTAKLGLGQEFWILCQQKSHRKKTPRGFLKLFLVICICVLLAYVYVDVCTSVGTYRSQRH